MRGTPLPAGVLPGGRFDEWRATPVRYLVADVDGTLLGTSPELTPTVIAALQRATRAGLPVGFATGRMTSGVLPVQRAARLSGPHLLHNGAEVRVDGAALASWPLAPAHVRAVLDVATERGAYAELYVGDGYWVTDRRSRAEIHWELLQRPPDGLVAELDLDEVSVHKATLLQFDRDPVDGLIDQLARSGVVVGTASSPLAPEVTFVNVTEPGVDKGRALRVAADHLDVPLSAVAAIGDGANDLPMLTTAGTAIAMGQAPANVQHVAHLVVPSVDDDGVAVAVDLLLEMSSQRPPRGDPTS